MKKTEAFFERYNYLFLLPILIVYLWTRYRYLGEVCYYLHIDELQAAYESLCLAVFGRDSLSVTPSLFFPGLGEGHNALYIYLSAILMKLKGGLFSHKLFKLISLAGGLLCLIFSYLTVCEISGSRTKAYLEAMLITTLPVFVISQRTGMEEYLFLEILPAAFFFLIKAVKSSKKLFYLIGGILFGLLLFTSETAYIILPLFMTSTVIYLMSLKKTDFRRAVFLSAPTLIFLILLLLISHGRLEMGVGNILTNIKNIRAFFWDDGHPFDVSTTFGTIYFFSVPFVVLGVVLTLKKVISSIKEKSYNEWVMLWLFALLILLCNLMLKNADIRTCNPIFFIISIFLTEGFIYLCDNLKGAYLIIIVLYLMSFGIFTHYYYENFNSEVNNSLDHESGIIVDKSIGEAVKEAMNSMPDKNIVIYAEDFSGRNLMIALFAGASPADYRAFSESDSFSFRRISVNPEGAMDESGDTIYIINQAEYPDIVDQMINQGWGNQYLKEYTILYRH